MNDACARLTGYEKTDVEGKMNCRDLFKSDICETTCPVRYCFDKGEPVEGIRATITDREERQIPIMTSASPLRDAHGKLIGAIEICKDITDVLEAERLRYIQKRAEREKKHRRYLEGRGKNLLYILTQVSDGNLNVRAEVLGKNDVMDEIAESLNSMIEQLSTAERELIEWGHTLEKRVEEKTGEIQKAQTQLIHSAKLASLGRMAAGVAHEINNPLTGVVTFAHLLRERFPEGSQEREDIEVVIEQANRCSSIIKGLLGFSRATPVEKRPINVNDVLEDSLSIVRRKADFFDIRIDLNLDEALQYIKADRSQLQQVFLNMIINAADSMFGKGTLTICTRKVTDNDKSFAEVEFTDTGHGISEENMAKLFEPFFTTKPAGKGTGLGLAVSHGIIQEHGGKILVKSKIGEETSFSVRLPFYEG
jgi:two-component system NtrC family sensor kinase